MAMGVPKIFGANVLYFAMLYELTKNNILFHLSVRVAEICLWGYQTRIIHTVDRFFISLMVEELFLLNQENSYVKDNL